MRAGLPASLAGLEVRVGGGGGPHLPAACQGLRTACC